MAGADSPSSGRWSSWTRCFRERPVRSLALFYASWKCLVALVVLGCPAPGYDTSTTLLAGSHAVPAISKFIRWDSIYFLQAAQRGYVFEQEWAFSYTYSSLLRWLASAVTTARHFAELAVTGVAVSHVSHALSVFLLWMLSGAVLGSETASQRTWCLISAALHVMSPAGAFLSAPYSESVFACVHFLGLYLYSIALRADHAGYLVRRDACWVAAGIAFAVATLIRSNGILSGCLFAYDAMEAGMEWLSRGLSVGLLRRMLFIGLGGGIIAVAMVGAQFVGYLSYCTATDPPRPWCRQLVPSIYNWVQSHYWNVGFLRYWTLSNLPLFLLAAPMLGLLAASSLFAFQHRLGMKPPDPVRRALLTRIAIPQALLAFLALTTYHVQTINRISSGYPLWYWYVASLGIESLASRSRRIFPRVVQSMALYGLVQAALFGSFLPPA
ncbi:hypothetical protein VTN49DRAFT_614 [Thermomyces lanuginosus]|uniref:uncharacterized protein n=1 Tax=Thermomyces lanuginosus TaxID=5541 RepID=UPI003742F8EC